MQPSGFIRIVFAIFMLEGCSGHAATPWSMPATNNEAGQSPDAPGSTRDAAGSASVEVAGPLSPSGSGGAPRGLDGPSATTDTRTEDTEAAPAGQPGDASSVVPSGTRTVEEIYCSPAAGPYPTPLVTGGQPSVVPIAPPGGIAFLEGPVWLAKRGVLLFSEWNSNHRILQLTPPQAIDVFMPTSRSNGLALTSDGQSLLMVTESPTAGVTRVSLADKSQQRLVETFNGQPFVQPNDLVVRADGTIYFTDYQAGRLYRRTVAGVLSVVASLPHSNGVALSPDEKTLYLNADTRTMRYPLQSDGVLGEGTEFATGLRGADGLAIDCAGNVYIAQNEGGALVVVSADGNRLGTIAGLPRVVTNAAFGDEDRRTLYITTSAALYAIKLQVPGLPH